MPRYLRTIYANREYVRQMTSRDAGGTPAVLLLSITVLVVASATAGAAYASRPGELQVGGGTSQFSEVCQTGGCYVKGISWIVSADAATQPRLSGARVLWVPSSASAEYQVRVEVYSGGQTLLCAGSAAARGSSSPMTTVVRFATQLPLNSVATMVVDIVEVP
jgi:hypothetical protein